VSELNREYLLEQFELIEEYLQRARRNAALSQEEYLADPTAIDASVRQLTVLFETSHNIAKHLSSRLGWRPSRSKAETSKTTSATSSASRSWWGVGWPPRNASRAARLPPGASLRPRLAAG
jgi:hypothetical protein